jgi:hypothetical protein
LDAQNFNDVEDSTLMDIPRVRIVLLKTKDQTIDTDKIARLRNSAKYIEDFFINQLQNKGYELENKTMYARNTDEEILIYTVESPVNASQLNNITNTGVNLAKAKYADLNDSNSIWAICHFKEGGGFTGGGKVNGGRMKFQYKQAEGMIDFSKHFAETDFHRAISFKAIAHELGHALGLPHNGPLRTNTAFNTLMGPVNNAYENTVGVNQTSKVLLSDYSAAMIAYHPIFKNKPFDTSELAAKTLQIEKVKGDFDLFSIDCLTGKARIRGKLYSEIPIHKVLIKFTHKQSGYWDKGFAISPDADGFFELPISATEINIQNIDEYQILASFENGLNRGVNHLGEEEALELDKNPYKSAYSFETDVAIDLEIWQNGDTLSSFFADGESYQWVNCSNDTAIPNANSRTYIAATNGEYALHILSFAGCTYQTNCVNTLLSNTTDLENKQNFIIYSNPNTGNFFIESKKGFIKEVKVYTLNGQLITQKKNNATKKIWIELPAKGYYLMMIQDDKGRVYKEKILSMGY